MNPVIQKLVDSGHLNEDQVADIEKRAEAFVDAAMKDHRFSAEAMQKLAGFGGAVSQGPVRSFGTDVLKTMAGTATGVLAAATVGGAAGLAQDAFKSMRESKDKAQAYSTMMEEAGDRIADLPAQQIQQSFNTLFRINPQYAQDPVVAAEFIRETNRSEAYPFQLLNTMKADSPRSTAPAFMDYQKLVGHSRMDKPDSSPTELGNAKAEQAVAEQSRKKELGYKEKTQ